MSTVTPAPQDTSTPPAWTKWAGLAVLLLVVVAYLPVLSAGYVWDDHDLVLANRSISSLSHWPTLFDQELWAGTDVPAVAAGRPGTGFYRPLLVLSLSVDHALGSLLGAGPAAATLAHMHSLAWHLAACALLWILLRRTVGPVGALVGLPLFALHPLQTEAVAWISARNDPMAAAFLLAAMLLLERDRPRPAAVVGGATLLLCALLTKESALLAPVILVLLACARSGTLGRLRSHAAVLVALVVYGLLRAHAGVSLPPRADLAHIQAVVPPSLAWYSHALLWPTRLAPGLHMAWPPAVPWGALALATLVCLLMLARGRRRAAAGLVFAALTLAPALAAVASQGLVADRYLYLPLAGLALALGSAVKRSGPALLVCAFLSLGGALLTSQQAAIWHDETSLWTASLTRHPSPWIYGVVARKLDLAGQLDPARPWYRRALAPPLPMAEACFRISRISLDLGDVQAALDDGRAALDAGCEPSAELIAPMAMAAALLGDWRQADDLAQRVDADPTGLIVVLQAAKGARQGDLGALQRALDAHPQQPAAALYSQVALVLEQAGEADVAARVRAAGAREPPLP